LSRLRIPALHKASGDAVAAEPWADRTPQALEGSGAHLTSAKRRSQ